MWLGLKLEFQYNVKSANGYKLCTRSKVLLKKLLVTHSVCFIESKCTLKYSQESTTRPHPETDETISHLHTRSLSKKIG